MKIIYKKGDLLKCDEGVIVHGCNAQGRMNSGVAKQLREADPAIYGVYKNKWTAQGCRLDVATIQLHNSVPLGKVVINAITQEFDKLDGKDDDYVFVDYGAIQMIARALNAMGPQPIALPKIGCGVANGDWEVVSRIIEAEAKHWQPVVYTLE